MSCRRTTIAEKIVQATTYLSRRVRCGTSGTEFAETILYAVSLRKAGHMDDGRASVQNPGQKLTWILVCCSRPTSLLARRSDHEAQKPFFFFSPKSYFLEVLSRAFAGWEDGVVSHG